MSDASVRKSTRIRKPKVEIYTPDEIITPESLRRPKLRPRKETNYKVEYDSFSGTFDNSNDKDYDDKTETDSDSSASSSDSELFSRKAKIKKPNNTRDDDSIFQSLETIDPTEEENEYRLQRQKNMQDRFKVLGELNFNEDIEGLKAVVTPLKKVEKAKKINKPVVKISSEPRIRRLSLRLQNRLSNTVFPDMELPLAPIESGKLSRKPNDSFTPIENVPFIENNDENSTKMLKLLQDDINLPYDQTCDFATGDFEKYCEIVKSCRLRYEPYKIIKDRIVSMDLHPSSKKLLLLAGDKFGSITIQDLVKTEVSLTFKSHTSNVNCITFSTKDHTKFFSTSFEGVTRLGDINSSNSTMVHQADDGEHTTWHHEFDESLFVAEGAGVVKLVDLRAPGENSSSFKCHRRSVRTVQLHPTNNNYFVTSSGSGEFGIFDIRASDSKKPNPVVLQEFDKGLSSAFISDQGNYVVSTCNDDTIRVFDVSDLQTATQISNVLHNNHTGRWLSVFKARWQPGRDDAYIVGSMMNPKRLQVYRHTGKIIHEFMSEAITTYSPVFIAHSTQPIYVGGTASGKIHVFAPFASLDEIYT